MSFVITTNATLLNDDMAEFLLDKRISVTYSIDGPKAIQDRNRIFADGKGSYDTVIQNIRKIYAADPVKMSTAGISMVVDQTQDYGEVLPLFEEPALRDMRVSYSMIEEDSRLLAPSLKYISHQNYDMFLSLVNLFRGDPDRPINKLMEQAVNVFEQDKDKITSTLLGKEGAPSGPCIPGKQRLFVDCFGNLYPCERVDENDTMKIGTLESGFDWNKVDEFLNFSRENLDSCKNCWAFLLCGICGKMAFNSHGYSKKMHLEACQSSKVNAYEIIRNKILVYENSRHKVT